MSTLRCMEFRVPRHWVVEARGQTTGYMTGFGTVNAAAEHAQFFTIDEASEVTRRLASQQSRYRFVVTSALCRCGR